MRDRIFYSICFGLMFGVLLRSFVFVNIFLVLLFSLIAFGLFLFFCLISKSKWGIIFSIFILAFGFGILRFHFADTAMPASFEAEVGQKTSFTGIISDEPDVRANNQALNIEVQNSKDKTHILASQDLGENFAYGDTINFTGKLEKPQNFLTDQGKVFDYVNYLRKDGILYVMKYPKIEIVSRGGGNFIKRELFSFKEKFLEKINYIIPSPESLLMGGLILGEKSNFDRVLKQSFVNTGTIHIVALSGYNVTIVAEWFMKLFGFLSLNFSIGMGILAIWLFVVMTGAVSTAIRAGIMATLALTARVTSRTYDVARVLILTGVVMLLFNPLILVYDVSFELSFIATAAVIFLAPRIEKYFSWVTPRFGLRDIISVTSAAYIFVMPFILYKMGNLSLVALPSNVLILPFIPGTMLLGFLTGFIGSISPILAMPFGFISYLLLHYELFVIHIFSILPFAALMIPNFPFIITLLIYMYFIYMLFGKNIKSFFDFTAPQ